MSTMANAASRNQVTMRMVWRFLIGAVVGAGCGGGFVWLLLRLHVSPRDTSWSDSLAMWLGVTFFGIGLALFVVSFNRRELAKNLEGQSAKLPATDSEVRAFRLQCATMVLAGVMLLLPLLAMGVTGNTSPVPGLVFAAIILLFTLQTVANVALWRSCDEFLRGQMLLAGAVTFAIGQAALFLWAAAEHLHLARSISSWDTITLLLTLYLATGCYLAVRNRPGR